MSRTLLRGSAVLVMISMTTLLLMGLASAEDFQETGTDRPGDVMDESTYLYVPKPPLDILSVSVSSHGDDVEVELALAGPHEDAAYYVVSVGEGDLQYDLIWTTDDGFRAYSIIGPEANVSGSFGPGGDRLVWAMSASELGFQSRLELRGATSYLMDKDGGRFIDTFTPNGGTPGGGTSPYLGFLEGPHEVTLNYVFDSVTKIRKDLTVQLDIAGATALRKAMDADGDGSVDAGEVDSFVALMSDELEERFSCRIEPDMRMKVTDSIEFNGAEGVVNGSAPAEFRFRSELELEYYPYDFRYNWTPEFDAEAALYGNATDGSWISIASTKDQPFLRKDLPKVLQDYLEDNGKKLYIRWGSLKGSPGEVVDTLKVMEFLPFREPVSSGPGLSALLTLAGAGVAASMAAARRRFQDGQG